MKLSLTLIIGIGCCLSALAFDAESIDEFIKEVQRQYLKINNDLIDASVDPDVLSRESLRLEAATCFLKKIRWYLIATKPCSNLLLNGILSHMEQLEIRIASTLCKMRRILPFLLEQEHFGPELTYSGTAGRPSFLISKEQLEFMRSYGMSWIEISKSLGVSIATIWRRRFKFGITSRRNKHYRTLAQNELRMIIEELKKTSHGIGIRMIEGFLRSKSLYARRDVIADVLRSTDPLGSILRWSEQVPRCKYQVKGPNSLWHVDGNHKMIRWRLVIHGGIDGYSRLVVFLRCSANNLSRTVGKLFLEAVETYQWPSRVRTDQGTENVHIARLMIEKRGEGRGSIIQGSSVHNQRIERLWRDVRKAVVEYYRQLFYFMEEHAILNPVDEIDLFCLHRVFLPKINYALTAFRKGWNNHRLSTEGGKTPNQLFISGMLQCHSSAIGREYFDEEVDPETYGIEEPETEEDIDHNNNVTLPDGLEVSSACLEELRANAHINEENSSNVNLCISEFQLCRQIVQRHIN